MSPLMYIIGGAYAIGIAFALVCAVYVWICRRADPAQPSPLQQAFTIIQNSLSPEIKNTLKTPDDARQAIQNWLSMNTFEGK